MRICSDGDHHADSSSSSCGSNNRRRCCAVGGVATALVAAARPRARSPAGLVAPPMLRDRIGCVINSIINNSRRSSSAD